jgi:hypothetical protein
MQGLLSRNADELHHFNLHTHFGTETTMCFYLLSAEFWAFEIVVLVSGLLPNPQLETSVLSIWYICIVDCID